MEYEEKLYEAVRQEDDTIDKSCWFDEKHKLGLAFPNLPYLVDNDLNLKITQTGAILQHLAAKSGLDGKTTIEKAHVNMLFGFSQDVRSRYTRAAYSSDFKSMKPDLLVWLDTKLIELEQWKEQNFCKYLVSDEVLYIDLLWWDLLDQLIVLSNKGLMDGKPSLREFYERVGRLPQIQTYRNSNRYIVQYNNTSATFRGPSYWTK